jgi:ubiquinone/menaquinone biosynthesis C-methylase UbiE
LSFYDDYVLPRLLDFACGLKAINRQREKVVPRASGTVLEIGIGSGLNLPYYDHERVNHVWGLEPAEAMRRRASSRLDELDVPLRLEFIDLPGEEIPLADDSVDCVLMTYTLCTIPDPIKALHGMRRVLRPGGSLYFCEHGQAPDASVSRWQHRLNGPWRRIAGGCNMNRDVPGLLDEAGFAIDDLQSMYVPGPRILGWNWWGSARVET